MSIHYWADFYKVPYVELYNTIKCESKFNPGAMGDGGKSCGIAQFYQPEKDWGFSCEKAKDPDFALQQMAKAWSENKMNRWSCYRSLDLGSISAPTLPE